MSGPASFQGAGGGTVRQVVGINGVTGAGVGAPGLIASQPFPKP